MRLRGHHLICRLGFQGLGYDERFTRTMKEVLTVLEWNPELKLKVVAKTDILCASCPNRKGDSCYNDSDSKQDQRIKSMDRIVLSALGLNDDILYTLDEINRRIANDFTLRDMDKLCKSCEWRSYGHCEKGLKKLKKRFKKESN